jgi:hypothetical protein
LRQAGPNTCQTSRGLLRPIRVVARSSASEYQYSTSGPLRALALAAKKTEVA